jgi:hypothetical protein
MNRYTASEARKVFFHLLDTVEAGEDVILERHGVRFRLTLELVEDTIDMPKVLQVDDPDILSGNWTWVGDDTGQLQFRARDTNDSA